MTDNFLVTGGEQQDEESEEENSEAGDDRDLEGNDEVRLLQPVTQVELELRSSPVNNVGQ